MLPDTYQMPEKAAIFELRERASRFIAYTFPIQTEEEGRQRLNELKKEHYAAVHHCWAYILEPDRALQKSSDDREPAGSAGKPILRAILASGLTNCMVVVVRYFGGKLLGVPRLIAAYGGSAESSIQLAGTCERRVFAVYQMELPFERHHEVIRLFKQFNIRFQPLAYDNWQGLNFELKPSLESSFLAKLGELDLPPVECIRNEK